MADVGDEQRKDPARVRFDRSVKIWDLALKSLGAGVALFGVWLAIGKSLSTERQHVAQQVRELDAEQLEKIGDLCGVLADTTADIAEAAKPDDVREQRKTFWGLYWGRLVMYEDDHLETAMVNFGKILKDWEKGAAHPAFEASALDVANKCKALQQAKREKLKTAER